jgi:CheY-like chemotaxis protein
MQLKPVDILLVEDNPGDVVLTQQALAEVKIRNRLVVAEDGIKALAILRREGEHAHAQRPDLIILDLNLPGKDGRQVLNEIKSDANLKTIPVIILTSSDNDSDIEQSYKLSANCYIQKPVDLDEFSKVVHTISDFWFSTVKLPEP